LRNAGPASALKLYSPTQLDELGVGAAFAGKIEDLPGGLLRRHTLGHEVGEHGDRDDQRLPRSDVVELAERAGRESGPERAGGGGELPLAGAPAERVARAPELSQQRFDCGSDPVTARAHGAPLERFLDQRLGWKAASPGRVHQMLHAVRGDRVQPFGKTSILSQKSRWESGEKAD
jgi:hypothetical protein